MAERLAPIRPILYDGAILICIGYHTFAVAERAHLRWKHADTFLCSEDRVASLKIESPASGIPVLEDLAWHAESVCLFVLDAEGRILRANGAAHRALDPLATGEPISKLLPESGAALLRAGLREARTAPVRGVQLNFSNESSALTLSCSIGWSGDSYFLLGDGVVERDQRMKQELLDLTRELVESNRERAKAARELERTLAELRSSHWHIRKIQEFLPTCCVCHNVRVTPDEEEAAWKSLSSFLSEHGLLMSHGYCPACEAKVLAELDAEFPPG